MNNYKTTFHRDGTVSLWNIFTQTWQHIMAGQISDEVLATLSPDERKRILKMASR